MINCQKLTWTIFYIFLASFCSSPLWALEVLDQNYLAETYLTFDTAGTRPPSYMTFDSGQNLYVAYYNTHNARDGKIYHVDSDKNVAVIASGLSRAWGITWTGGTDYGDYLYITEGWAVSSWPKGRVTRIHPDGTVEPFSGTGLNQPVALEVDRYGNYGGHIYASSSAHDKISKVLLSGQVQTFYVFPGVGSGGAEDIAFDPDDSYGGLMYVAASFTSPAELSGVLAFNAAGIPTKFATQIRHGYQAEFDTTANQFFGGYLYIMGKADGENAYSVFRVYPDGQVEKIVTALMYKSALEFGPDGAMYLMESHFSTTEVTITRISPKISYIAVDIKPQSCPNPLNVKSKGVLPVAILGSDDLDVMDIDAASIRLAGIAPLRSSLEDVAAPLTPISDPCACDCTSAGPDGFIDLTLKFKTQDIVPVLGEVNHNDVLELFLTARLNDNSQLVGSDCLTIKGKFKPLSQSDINRDGIVNMADFALLSQNWLDSSIIDDRSFDLKKKK